MPISKGKKLAVGVGLGAAAAGAGYYYFFGAKGSAKNRRAAIAWATKLKRDVISQAKKLKALDEKVVKKVVTEASKAYAKMKTIDERDLKQAVSELHDHWRAVKQEAMSAGKRAVRKATKKKAGKR